MLPLVIVWVPLKCVGVKSVIKYFNYKLYDHNMTYYRKVKQSIPDGGRCQVCRMKVVVWMADKGVAYLG